MRVLVVGASSGIGAALVDALAADGHSVFACARRMPRAGFEEQVPAMPCDISREIEVRDLFAWIHDFTAMLDAVIVAAGTFGEIGRVQGTDVQAWEATIRTNLIGLYLVAKHAIAPLERAPKPRLIAFAGGGAFSPFPRFSAYACSKAATVRFVECLAGEYPRIAVNAVSPGMVDTPIHRQTVAAGQWRAGRVQFQKTLDMQDSGGWVPMSIPVDCVRWLLSDAADGITGRTIAANYDDWREPGFTARLLADPLLCRLTRFA